MTTETLIRPPQPAPLEPPTAPLRLGEPPLDALDFLDHRMRRRVLQRRLAGPGHYLAMSAGDEERLLPIAERITHVGRSLGAELRFEEVHVSRRHAIVVRYGHHVRVLDDRSSEGTFVNGTRIVATDLQDGDVIGLGRLALRYLRVR
jgi:hypothetical protein